MAPRRNTNRSGRNSGSSPSASTIALRESRPIPYVQTPPSDPPSIRKNRPVDLQLKWKPTAATGTDLITFGNVVTALEDYGYESTSEYFFTVNYIHVWADSSLDAVDLSLYDVSTGVATTDNGATTHRARVGLHYPKVLQVPRKQDATGNIAGITISSGDPSETDVRIGVTVWMNSSVL